MRACLIAALLFCGGIGAQIPQPSTAPPTTYLINAGGPAIPAVFDPTTPIPAYQADTFFNGGTAWVDPTMGAGIWGTLRYAPFFTYDIPVANGFYSLKFDLLEPNKTGPNQRVFTISVNSVTSDPIDIFAMTGGINLQTSVNLMAYSGNGHLRIIFQATAGNAVVSGIEIAPSNVFSGVETRFLWIYTCAPQVSTDTVCIAVNPTGTANATPAK